VASFCYDEPVAEFLQAAGRIPDVTFHVTGNDRKLPATVRDSAPPNVSFTGFLSDAEYVGQLQASDAIIALTRLKHTMQRAAYESIFLSRPVLTSDSELLRETFRKGAVHVATDAESIRTGLIALRDNLVALSEEAAELRTEFIDRWQHTLVELQRVLALSPTQEPGPQPQGSIVESRS
jgi:glycosyltransferase involved in cell wall biosynthesis